MHAVPHWPQFFVSEPGSTQAPEQQAPSDPLASGQAALSGVDAVHACTPHALPCRQSRPASVQSLPHWPQFCTAVTSTQPVPGQQTSAKPASRSQKAMLRPRPQSAGVPLHSPSTHEEPAGQAMLQPPQF